MGIKKVVDVSFWDDDKVSEMFTPEDKYFMLYLLTNPHSSLLGIYHISQKIIAFETGYSIETVNSLIDRFQNKYEIIIYDKETREIAIKNYLKYGIIAGGKPVVDRLKKDIENVKNKQLVNYVFENVKGKTNNETIEKLINEYVNEYVNVYEYVYVDSYNDSYNDSCNDSSDDSYNDSSNNKNEKEIPKINYQEFQDIYTSTCTSMSGIREISDKRKKKIKTFLKKNTVEDFKEVCRLAEESDFLSGRNRKWTGCNFDWLIDSEHALNILEGKYKNKEVSNGYSNNKQCDSDVGKDDTPEAIRKSLNYGLI